ncbi:MAG: hypothetical protein K2H52_18245 [Lachnospiraceae bacterium]|nr:hypothetical protein [Lachnospiraceae bacterium]
MAISGVTDYTNTYVAGRTNRNSGLSGEAQNYLSGLKEKYPDANVTVTDFKNGKQEDNYMFGCSGGNNVAISANIIEKMAKDPAAAAKYEKVIADAPKAAEEIKEGLAAHGAEMVAGGTVIDKDGKVSYWCIGKHEPPKDSPIVSYKKQMQEQLDEKRAKKKEEEALKEKRLEKAETLEKLMEQIKAGTSQPAKMQEEGKGAQLDLTI